MLNTLSRHSPDSIRAIDEVQPRDLINVDLRSVVNFLRRNAWLIGITAIVCAILAVGYVKLTPKLYTATAQVLIDTRKLDLFRAQAVIEDPAINTAAIESQMQILRSDEIARKVITDGQLKLLETKEFGVEPPTLARRVVLAVSQLWSPAKYPDETVDHRSPAENGWLRQIVVQRFPASLNPFPPGPRSSSETIQQAVQKFQSQVSVTRIGLSYVIQIQFVSQDPAISAAVANTIASTYIAEQLRSKLEMAEHAGNWLQGRIAELRDHATNSDRAVQTFKAEHNIINAGDQLMTDQQVQELSKQRILAEANVAEAKARYDRIKAVNESQGKSGSVTDALDNPVIIRLQERYLDLTRQQSDFAERYGPTHRTVAALDREIDQTRADMSAELRRLEETYKSDYEIASTRLEQLQIALDKLMGTSGKALQAQVELRELESTSNSYSSLYNSFLERYIQTVQQQTFPITEAKIITPAAKPLKSSGPGGLVVLGGALALGTLLGCGFALGREMLDRLVRTPDQLERLSGADFLGVLPIIKRGQRKAAEPGTDPVENPFASMPSRMRHVLDAPLSLYAETIRSIKIAADVPRGPQPLQVVGTVSALPGEGKSTVAANLAFIMARAPAARTLLVDLDLRNPSKIRNLGRNRDGVVQLLAGKTSFKEAVCVGASSGLHFLPAGVNRPLSNTSEFLKSRAMQQMLDEARQHYDYVVLDLPPLAPLVDVRAVAQYVDGFVLVTEFGKTPSDVLRRALKSAPEVKQKLIGAVLNKVDLNALRRIEDVPSSYYNSDYYVEDVRKAPFVRETGPAEDRRISA
jgi:polysaccharide biosynthesis transport protein